MRLDYQPGERQATARSGDVSSTRKQSITRNATSEEANIPSRLRQLDFCKRRRPTDTRSRAVSLVDLEI